MSESFAQRVERLKQNEKPFGLHTQEDQQAFAKIGPRNCLVLSADSLWYFCKEDVFHYNYTYVIPHDYQPKPEYVDLPIEKENVTEGFLGVWKTEKSRFLRYPFIHLHCLPSLPGFVGFYLTETSEKDNDYYIGFDSVARYLREGRPVVARFRKE